MWESSASDLVTRISNIRVVASMNWALGRSSFRQQVGTGVEGAAKAHFDAAQLDTDAAIAKAAVGQQLGQLTWGNVRTDPREGHHVFHVALQDRERTF